MELRLWEESHSRRTRLGKDAESQISWLKGRKISPVVWQSDEVDGRWGTRVKASTSHLGLWVGPLEHLNLRSWQTQRQERQAAG